MTNLFSVGLYSKLNNTFIKSGTVKYLIATRKKTTPNKPKKFIIAKVKGKDYYISSLYPTAVNNQFNADYSGKKFTLIISENQVEVKNRSVL